MKNVRFDGATVKIERRTGSTQTPTCASEIYVGVSRNTEGEVFAVNLNGLDSAAITAQSARDVANAILLVLGDE